jgi:hypothetical protein
MCQARVPLAHRICVRGGEISAIFISELECGIEYRHPVKSYIVNLICLELVLLLIAASCATVKRLHGQATKGTHSNVSQERYFPATFAPIPRNSGHFQSQLTVLATHPNEYPPSGGQVTKS